MHPQRFTLTFLFVIPLLTGLCSLALAQSGITAPSVVTPIDGATYHASFQQLDPDGPGVIAAPVAAQSHHPYNYNNFRSTPFDWTFNDTFILMHGYRYSNGQASGSAAAQAHHNATETVTVPANYNYITSYDLSIDAVLFKPFSYETDAISIDLTHYDFQAGGYTRFMTTSIWGVQYP